MSTRADRPLALAVGLALALCFACLAAVSVAGWSIGTVTHTTHRELAGPVRELRLSVGSGDVTITPGGDRVTIDSRVRGSLRAPRPSIRLQGDAVRVQGGCGNIVFGHCESTFAVRVPAGTAVRLDATSGDVQVNGLSAPVTIRASSGDVELGDLSGGTDVRVSSGDIEADALSGRVALQSSSGDVVANRLRADTVRLQAASGDVEADLATIPEEVDVSSSSGDVVLGVPHATYNVEAETDSGERHVEVSSDPLSKRILRVQAHSGDVAVVNNRQ